MLIDICIKFREYSFSGFQVIERTLFVTDRQTDGRTDRQTDGRPGKNKMSPDPKGGDIIINTKSHPKVPVLGFIYKLGLKIMKFNFLIFQPKYMPIFALRMFF